MIIFTFSNTYELSPYINVVLVISLYFSVEDSINALPCRRLGADDGVGVDQLQLL